MTRGYFRRIEQEQNNLGKILFMIDTTKPRARGSRRLKLEDFLPQKESVKRSELTLEERQKIAIENAKKLEKFKKGVVYSEV